MSALEYLKEIEWTNAGLCPVCCRTREEQHAQWCRLDRAIGILERSTRVEQPLGKADAKEILLKRCAELNPRSQTEPIPFVEQPKAGEFVKDWRKSREKHIEVKTPTDNPQFYLKWLEAKTDEACVIIDRLEQDNKILHKRLSDLAAKGMKEIGFTPTEQPKIEFEHKSIGPL